MTATVGLRSGLSRHWTGSLLELNCNGPETFHDYLDTSNDNPFYLNWQTESFSVFDSSQGLRENCYLSKAAHANEDATRFDGTYHTVASGLTPNQLFRLRQLISLLGRYRKTSSEYSGHSSCSSDSSSQSNQSFDAFNTTNQQFMRSLGRPSGFNNEHKLVQALFDANLERFFPNETGFLLITKSKRRHCSSEGDLTFVNGGRCSPVRTDRLSNSVTNIANPSDIPQSELEPQSLTSGSSVETLSDPNDALRLLDGESIPVQEPSDDSSTDQSTIEDVNIQSSPSEVGSIDSNWSDSTNQIDDLSEENSKPTTDCAKLPDSTATVQVDKGDATVVKPPLNLKISHADNIDLFDGELLDTRLTQSELSSPQVRKLEREDSTASASGSRLVKTVSFADEVGQSLTEVFLFRKTEEESLIPDYEDDFDGPIFNFQRKSKISSYGRFTRVRNKRYAEEFSTPTYGALPSLSSPGLRKPNYGNEATDTGRYLWFLGFSQPAAQYYEFRQRVENRCVSLENITLTQPEDNNQQVQQTGDESTQSQPQRLPYLSGTIKVKNVHFDKKVWLRITTNHWVTHIDCPATYNADLSSGGVWGSTRFDTFTFQLTTSDYPHEVNNVERIEFAIRFCAGPDGSHGQFWDNNDGRNYVIERRRVESGWSSPTNSSPALVAAANSSNPYTGLSDYSSHETSSTPINTCNPYTLDYRPNFAGISSFTDYRAWEHFASESIYY